MQLRGGGSCTVVSNTCVAAFLSAAADEEDVEGAESREHKRWIERYGPTRLVDTGPGGPPLSTDSSTQLSA